MSDNTLMKDHIGPAAIHHIAHVFSLAMPGFAASSFIAASQQDLASLELKQRVHHVIAALHQHLPADFSKTTRILRKIRKHWHSGKEGSDVHAFAAWPVIDYISVHGLDHPHLALPLLQELTPLFSAEFALRPFLLRHFDITYAYLQQWCLDPDEHVRRLASEGSRPRLPWGLRLQSFCDDPAPLLPLLASLRADHSLYVRKSVANSLNDISRDNPDIVIKTCMAWQQQASEQTQWIIRHATRSLVKAGHAGALQLLGYTASPAIRLDNLALRSYSLQLGDELAFSFAIQSQSRAEQRLVIDYAIHHVKANGSLSAKVFKLKSLTLKANEQVNISKRHPLQAITTRRYYSGTHCLEILVNGISVSTTDFILKV